MQAELKRLIDDTWTAVEARRDRRSGTAAARPALEPLERERVDSRPGDDFPVLAHLDEALHLARAGELAPLAASFAAARASIRWSQNASYDETSVGRELLDNYAYACLSGPDCLQPCEAPLAGYILLGPNFEYPDHNHAAREVYLALTPGARWRLDSGDWFEVEAGDLIVHESWQMHATRTGDRPFLAFAAWLERGERSAIRI
jgi:hypothetical protein